MKNSVIVNKGKKRIYWKIEFLNKDNYSIPCFSPKFYGSFADCKIWINAVDFLKALSNDKKLKRKITLQINK